MECISWPERVSSNKERVVEELTQGRELASQLRRALDKGEVVGGGGSAEVIMNKILGSFAYTLDILEGKESDQTQANSGGGSGGSSSWDEHVAIQSEEYSQESSKSTPSFKDRRGSYKRRKTSHSWTRDTPALTDDGHVWRKYGQKDILNSDHPRNYFRCTHKLDQECKATKHVQKIQDHPPVYRTTYYGNHVCRNYLRASELVVDCNSPSNASNFISFDTTNKQTHPFFSAFSTPVEKEESPPSDYRVSTDAKPFESPRAMSGFSPTIDDYDYEDVISEFIRGVYGFDDGVMQFAF